MYVFVAENNLVLDSLVSVFGFVGNPDFIRPSKFSTVTNINAYLVEHYRCVYLMLCQQYAQNIVVHCDDWLPIHMSSEESGVIYIVELNVYSQNRDIPKNVLPLYSSHESMATGLIPRMNDFLTGRYSCEVES